MKKITRLFLLLLIVHGIQLYAQEKTVTYLADPNSIPPELIVALHHIDANLTILPNEKKVIGDVSIRFTPNRYKTDSIVFSAPGFEVRSIRIGDRPCRYRQNGSSLIIYQDLTLERNKDYVLRISYESKPAPAGIYFVGWDRKEEGKRKQVWAHRPFGWLPYMDARVTMDLRITFDKKYTVFTNGERQSVTENRNGTRTWHYRMTRDHPYFSTALGIGDYEYRESKTNRGIPLEFLYYRGMENKVGPTYAYTEQMFTFFEEEMGVSYPYPVYREIPVIDYMYGGMETTTSTIFGDYMLIDPRAYWQRNYINVNAHELAHQWYGDAIAHLAHKDVWLTESFGTYFAKMFEKSIFGEDFYQNEMNNERNITLAAASRNNYPVGGSRGGVERIYQKGSLVLGMLRYVMGDREFKDAIQAYTQKYLFKYAETNDFIRTVYDVTGIPYNWFFDQWILRGGEPEYSVEVMRNPDSTIFMVNQVHDTSRLIGYFKMPVVFEVHYSDGTKDSTRIWIERAQHRTALAKPTGKEIAYTLFDPGRNILKKITFSKSFGELSAQALKARNMIDRYDALLALRDIPTNEKRNLLFDCFRQERFHLAKTEILKQLAGDNTPEAVSITLEAVKDPDAHVRKAALLLTNPIPDLLRESFESLLTDSSYLNVELALDALCRDFPQERTRYLALTAHEEGWRGKNIRMKWLGIAIGAGEKEHLAELISYTSPKFDFETRINAFNTLRQLDYFDPDAAKNLVEASLHWNNKLSSAAKDAIGYYIKQDKFKQMIEHATNGDHH